MRPDDFRTQRKRLGLTQAELATALGVTPKTVCERENGKVPITRETKLAMAYLMLNAPLVLARKRRARRGT